MASPVIFLDLVQRVNPPPLLLLILLLFLLLHMTGYHTLTYNIYTGVFSIFGSLLLCICKDSRKPALAGLLFADVLRIKMIYVAVKLLLTYWTD